MKIKQMTSIMPKGWKNYIKTAVIKAIQMDKDFQVETLEGIMQGRKGDYLIEGIEGELYPCKKEIFKRTYKLLENKEYKMSKSVKKRLEIQARKDY